MEEKPRVNVLVVDAGSSGRGTIVDKLKESGFGAVVVDSATTALARLDQDQFSVVFTLVGSGDGDQSFFSELRARHISAAVVVVLTGDGLSSLGEFITWGADEFCILPRDLERLPLIVTLALERRHAAMATGQALRKYETVVKRISKEVDRSKEVLEQNYLDMVKAFVGLLETRDLHMGSHCKRVATFCRAICDLYDLKDRVKQEIEIGALLHDIGKISIPDLILVKTRSFFSKTELTNKERAVYQKHPVIGQETVEMVSAMTNVGTYIRHHHERFNGTGYPDGLKGFHIPLGARIIGLVDAYDRIVYGVEKGKQEDAEILFLKYLEKQRGEVFDPEVVEKLNVFMQEFKRKKYSDERRVTVSQLSAGMILSRDVYTKSGVLVISQYEKISGGDIERLNRFLTSNMVLDGVYIFGSVSGGESLIPRKRTKRQDMPDTEVSEISAEEVIAAIDAAKDSATLAPVQESMLASIADAKSTRDDIVAAVKRCPVISFKVLRIANSPLFGFSRSITTIDEAVPLLGINEIRKIISSVPVIEETPDDVFNRQAFWLHQVGCGIISRIIGTRLDAKSTDEFYTAGLFHDIGELMMDQLFPDQFRRVIRQAAVESMFYRKAERLMFGQPHNDIGDYLLRKWNMPDIIVDAVKNHHSPMDSKLDSTLVSAVHLADIIAHMLHIGESGERTIPKYEPFAERQLGISLADLETLVPEIDEQFKATRDLMFIRH